jgi:hypothetical protein
MCTWRVSADVDEEKGSDSATKCASVEELRSGAAAWCRTSRRVASKFRYLWALARTRRNGAEGARSRHVPPSARLPHSACILCYASIQWEPENVSGSGRQLSRPRSLCIARPRETCITCVLGFSVGGALDAAVPISRDVRIRRGRYPEKASSYFSAGALRCKASAAM